MEYRTSKLLFQWATLPKELKPVTDWERILVDAEKEVRDFIADDNTHPSDNPAIMISLVHLAERDGEWFDNNQWQPVEHYKKLITELTFALHRDERELSDLEKALSELVFDDLANYHEQASGTVKVQSYEPEHTYQSWLDILSEMFVLELQV